MVWYYVRDAFYWQPADSSIRPFAATPFIAWYTEGKSSRKGTLMIGLLALAWSQILLMESRKYWIMAIARVLQGISAAAVWTAGLALV